MKTFKRIINKMAPYAAVLSLLLTIGPTLVYGFMSVMQILGEHWLNALFFLGLLAIGVIFLVVWIRDVQIRRRETRLQRAIQEAMKLVKAEPLMSDVIERKWRNSEDAVTVERLRHFLMDCFPEEKQHPKDTALEEEIVGYRLLKVNTMGNLYCAMRCTIVRRHILRDKWDVRYAYYEANRAIAFLYPSFFDTAWRDATTEDRTLFDTIREYPDFELIEIEKKDVRRKQLAAPVPEQITFDRVVQVAFPQEGLSGPWKFNPNHGPYKIVPDGDIDGYVSLKPPCITESLYPLVREAKDLYHSARERHKAK